MMSTPAKYNSTRFCDKKLLIMVEKLSDSFIEEMTGRGNAVIPEQVEVIEISDSEDEISSTDEKAEIKSNEEEKKLVEEKGTEVKDMSDSKETGIKRKVKETEEPPSEGISKKARVKQEKEAD